MYRVVWMEVSDVSTTTDDWEEIDLGDDVTALDDVEADSGGGVITCCQPHRSEE